VGAALSEFRDFGIHAQMCIELAEERIAAVPTGLDEILSCARSLGDDYAGTLIGSMQSPSETINTWIGRLCRLNRPVVLFDNDDSQDAITRQSVGARKHFYRCFHNERQSVELCLRTLHGLGHRRIGCIHTSGDIGWMKRRVALIEETARRIDPAIVVTRACLEDEFGVYDDVRDMSPARTMDHYDIDTFVNRFRTSSNEIPVQRTAGPPPNASGKLLWQRAASLRNLLGTTTAWISPNDYYQQKVYLWTMCVGVRVPGDVSLVSFDNAATSFVFPLASIDPGFQHLGYLAAHIFIGDIGVAADRGGGVAGHCRLVDRGSLAQPVDFGKMAAPAAEGDHTRAAFPVQ
jgi:DNA-binding LacI/PurR family transcriptional regulator